MKVAHKNSSLKTTAADWLNEAKDLERQGEPEKAAAIFEKLITRDPLNEYAYDRLMIIYRKSKNYKKEKAVIAAGIRAFEQFYKNTSKIAATKEIVSLSKALMKATGLADKKGNLLYDKEPLARWKKRKQVVDKKLKA